MQSTFSQLDDATRKAAVLISTLDTRSADLLLDRMGPDQAQRVRNAVLQLDRVSSVEEESILADFLRSNDHENDPHDGIEIDSSLVEKLAQSNVPGSAVIDEDMTEDDSQPFRFLDEATTDVLASHLTAENPQVIAVVAAHLAPQRAAELIKRLDGRLQVDVLRRVAELDISDASILLDVEQHLRVLLADEIRAARNRATGVAAVSSILMAAGDDRGSLWENVGRHDHDLVHLLEQSLKPSNRKSAAVPLPEGRREQTLQPTSDDVADASPAELDVADDDVAAQATINPPLHDFTTLAQLSDPDLATLFQSVPSELLLLSLAGAERSFVNRLLKPLLSREARALHRRLATLGPMRLNDIERAQSRVTSIAEQLSRSGAIGSLVPRKFTAAA